MSHLFKLSIAAAAAAALSFSAYAGSDAAGVKGGKISGDAIGTSHKLQKTYFDTDAPGSALASGFNKVGTTLTLNCANAAGCTVAGNFNAQLAAIGSENAAAICLAIDGGYVNCPYNAIIRAGGGYQVANYQTFAGVAYGNHTVDMYVYVNSATTLYRWNKEIKLYRP